MVNNINKEYNNLRREIRKKNIKGSLGAMGAITLAVFGVVLVAIGAVIMGLGEGCQEGAKRSKNYAQTNFEEAQQLKEEGQRGKAADNQEFKEGLQKERKVDLSESEVDSDLEDSFIELTA